MVSRGSVFRLCSILFQFKILYWFVWGQGRLTSFRPQVKKSNLFFLYPVVPIAVVFVKLLLIRAGALAKRAVAHQGICEYLTYFFHSGPLSAIFEDYQQWWIPKWHLLETVKLVICKFFWFCWSFGNQPIKNNSELCFHNKTPLGMTQTAFSSQCKKTFASLSPQKKIKIKKLSRAAQHSFLKALVSLTSGI